MAFAAAAAAAGGGDDGDADIAGNNDAGETHSERCSCHSYW